jgi:hypothetical protein
MRSPPALCFRGQLSSEFFSSEFFSSEFFSSEFFSSEFFSAEVCSAELPQLCMERLIFFLRYLLGFSALPVIS